MYKAIQNKKYYLAVETFRKQRKSLSKVYISGIRIWDSDDSKTYSIVIHTFRIMFSIKKNVEKFVGQFKNK
jgi:hypothetical protein